MNSDFDLTSIRIGADESKTNTAGNNPPKPQEQLPKAANPTAPRRQMPASEAKPMQSVPRQAQMPNRTPTQQNVPQKPKTQNPARQADPTKPRPKVEPKAEAPAQPAPAKKSPKKKRKKRSRIVRIFRRNPLLLIVAAVVLIVLLILIIHGLGNKDNAKADMASALAPTSVSAAEAADSREEASAEEAVEIEPTSLTLLAVGDNLIHDTVYQYAQQEDGSYDFTAIYKELQPEIAAADIACIQQETIFVSDPAYYSNYPSFGTPAEMADSLVEVGFDVVCHASNHTVDKGETGISDTLAAWEKYPAITVLGIHDSQEDADIIRTVEKNGITLALLDYTYGLNDITPPESYSVDMLTEENRDRITEQIAEAKEKSDMVVVFMHAGTENQFTPDSSQEEWAQFFADSGVGLVIGTHPHVVEPVEELTGKDGNTMVVYYSLGNFVSSMSSNYNLIGGMAKVTISKDSSGTRVSDYSIEPVVTLITGGGTVGYGYQFTVMHLEDYTEEMGNEHIRSGCDPATFRSIWTDVFGEDSLTEDGEDNADTDNTAA